LWRRGAVLNHKSSDTFARIIEESRRIDIRVKGTEKTAYIASLRETIKAIFEDYKVIKPDLLYEVLRPEESAKSELPPRLEKEKPLMLSEEVIRGYLQATRPFFDAPNGRELPLDVTGRGYAINEIFIGEVVVKNFLNINGNGNIIANESSRSIVGSNVNQSLPATVTEEQYKHILEMLEKFLESEQAKKLTVEDFEKLQKESAEVLTLPPKNGWERLRGFLSDTANITTIATVISMYLAAHPEIPKTVLSVFASFMP
jgi:hypothetical protein